VTTLETETERAPARSQHGCLSRTAGVLVLGSDYRALGVARSLGRRSVTVWLVRVGDDRLGGLSRYVQRQFAFPPVDPEHQIDFLLDLAGKYRLEGWVLLPTADQTAALVSQHHERLALCYRVAVPPWSVLRWAHDKRRTHAVADAVGIPYPTTHYPCDRSEVETLECAFPAVLKPAIKEDFNRLTAAKAWRVDSHEELVARYVEACELVDPELLTVQELIPGGGECQLAYGALARNGEVIASIVAERTRQYPMDFGRASTFVRSVDDAEVAALAERVIAQIGFTGLIEVEFKRDPRDGRCKLLDLNPRPWGWHTLSARAGVDFPYLLWRMTRGDALPERLRGRPNVSWMRISTDLPTSLREILNGRLSIGAYLSSFRGPRVSAIFSFDDPVPGLLEVPLLALVAGRRLAARGPV